MFGRGLQQFNKIVIAIKYHVIILYLYLAEIVKKKKKSVYITFNESQTTSFTTKQYYIINLKIIFATYSNRFNSLKRRKPTEKNLRSTLQQRKKHIQTNVPISATGIHHIIVNKWIQCLDEISMNNVFLSTFHSGDHIIRYCFNRLSLKDIIIIIIYSTINNYQRSSKLQRHTRC